MVQLTKLAGVFAFAASVTAVPIVGRTDHGASGHQEMQMEYAPSYAPEQAQHEANVVEVVEHQPKVAEVVHEPAPQHETPTHVVEAVKETSVSYGSGSWDKSGYNDCVSQCMAKFGGGQANTYQPVEHAVESAGSVGEGAVHTVIVAPQQGVLRYVPPFIDANVGDTIVFQWGADNHTVTKSSALLPCNRTEDALFTSGRQNKDFTFTQRVNTTDPIYFHCATPGHCSKGMFGVLNYQKAEGESSSGNWISSYNSSNSSAYSSYMSYTAEMTANNTVAANWGSNFDMTTVPEWAAEPLMENIMYMRNVIAMNPDLVDESGNVSLAGTSAPLMLPNDVNAVASSEGASEGTTTETTETDAEAQVEETVDSAAGAATESNAAGSLTSSRMVMGAAVALATFFLL